MTFASKTNSKSLKFAIKLTKQFQLRGIPTTILINKESKEFARIIGEIDFNDKKFVEWLRQFI